MSKAASNSASTLLKITTQTRPTKRGHLTSFNFISVLHVLNVVDNTTGYVRTVMQPVMSEGAQSILTAYYQRQRKTDLADSGLFLVLP